MKHSPPAHINSVAHVCGARTRTDFRCIHKRTLYCSALVDLIIICVHNISASWLSLLLRHCCLFVCISLSSHSAARHSTASSKLTVKFDMFASELWLINLNSAMIKKSQVETKWCCSNNTRGKMLCTRRAILFLINSNNTIIVIETLAFLAATSKQHGAASEIIFAVQCTDAYRHCNSWRSFAIQSQYYVRRCKQFQQNNLKESRFFDPVCWEKWCQCIVALVFYNEIAGG